MRHANATMRKLLTGHNQTSVHTDTGIRQSHPVRHGSPFPLTTGRYRVFAGIGICNKDGTICPTNRTEPAGEVLFLLLQNHERAAGGGCFIRTGRNRPIQSYPAIHIQAAALLL